MDPNIKKVENTPCPDVTLIFANCLSSASQRDNGGPAPNTYVEVYLHPDSEKVTKRKTRIVRQTFNPSFNEMVSSPQ